MATKATKTPAFASHPLRCDGLVLEVGSEGMSHASAKRLAKRVVRESIPGDWTLTPLGPKKRPGRRFELLRRRPQTQPTLKQAFNWAARLRTHRDVADAEVVVLQPGAEPIPSQVMNPRALPPSGFFAGGNEPCSSSADWSVDLVKAPQAWALPLPGGGKKQGSGTLIAHPDTGYTNHPEIETGNRLLADRGFDFEDERPDPEDPLVGFFPSHGTATASVIMSAIGSQLANPSEFVTGIAPKAKLIPYRVSTNVVHLSFRKLTRAIYAAIDEKAHVISMSLGGPLSSNYLHEAIQEAVGEGILVLAAAGNYWPFVVFPAAFDEVVAVAAVNCDREPWSFSARGDEVDLAAPGESVWKAQSLETGAFRVNRDSGTSFAVATVAGAAACWLAFHGRTRLIQRYGKPGLVAVFKEILVQAGVDRPPGWDRSDYGAGILNTSKLLSAPLPSTPPASGPSGVAFPSGIPSRNRLDALAHYFPKTTRHKMENTLAKLLHCKSDESAELDRLLAIHGSELSFVITTIPSFRETLESCAERGRGVSQTQLVSNAELMRHLSKPLKDILIPKPPRARGRRSSKKK